MKELQSILKLLAVALVAAVALALVLTGRAAVQARAEYQMQLAPRTLHQMVLETEAAARPDRSSTLLHGAGMLALAGLAFGAFVVGMNGGTGFLREVRLGRKKKHPRGRSPYSPYPTIEGPPSDPDPARIAPAARMAPLLRDGRDNARPPYDYPGER